jgi:hypothetical protein
MTQVNTTRRSSDNLDTSRDLFHAAVAAASAPLAVVSGVAPTHIGGSLPTHATVNVGWELDAGAHSPEPPAHIAAESTPDYIDAITGGEDEEEAEDNTSLFDLLHPPPLVPNQPVGRRTRSSVKDAKQP